MTGGFYEPGEYLGAPVYDSEGLLYGRVCGYEFHETGPRLRVCVDATVSGYVPDADALRRLLEREGVALEGGETLEELVLLARERGLDVPVRRTVSRVEMVKGYVEPGEIRVVDRMEDGRLLVLLSQPREARFRGLKQLPPPRPLPGAVEGRPVVSLEKGYLGRARGLVIGAGGVGVRSVRMLDSYVAWMAYLAELRRRGLNRLAEELAARIGDPLTVKRLPVAELPRIEESLRGLGAPGEARELLRSMIRSERSIVADTPWSRVLRAADAVIVE